MYVGGKLGKYGSFSIRFEEEGKVISSSCTAIIIKVVMQLFPIRFGNMYCLSCSSCALTVEAPILSGILGEHRI
jgi:hypothetical protein